MSVWAEKNVVVKMHQALYLRSVQGCSTINGDRSSWSHSKMKVNGIAFIVYFLLKWSFLSLKIPSLFLRDNFWRIICMENKRCNALGSAVLLIKKYFLFFNYMDVTWRHLGEYWFLAVIWHLLAFSLYFLMKTILFLYSLGNQDSADLQFHVMCY